MFNRLPESNARRQRRTGGFVVSTVVHLALIALAVQATGLTAAPRPKPDISDVLVFTPPLPTRPSPPPPNTRPPSTNASGPAVPTPPTLSITIPDRIPDTLPDPGAMANLIDQLFDPNRGHIADQPTATPNVGGDAPHTENTVEKAVVALPGSATPRYPSMLQSAGVDGQVRAQFVVDTLGRVEQGSFRALESTHDLFTASVREALARARFTPAEAGGAQGETAGRAGLHVQHHEIASPRVRGRGGTVSAGPAGMTRHPDDAPIRAVHFDRGTRTLRVELTSGAVYDYADVPERVYDELARAPSRDSYFRENVREEFIGSRVGEVDLAEMAHERREDSMFGAPLAERTSDPAELPAAGASRHDAERHGSHHTWVVDVIEDDAAAVEVDGRRVTPIPRWLLPADAKDGDVLHVTHTRSASRSTFTIEVDHDATRLAYERSAEQLRNAPPGGSGDIDLNT